MANADETAATAAAAKVDAAVLTQAGQRRINVLWEVTQTVLALSVVVPMTIVSAVLSMHGDVPALVQMGTFGGVVIGFYFGRTNHQRTGGVGANDMGR